MLCWVLLPIVLRSESSFGVLIPRVGSLGRVVVVRSLEKCVCKCDLLCVICVIHSLKNQRNLILLLNLGEY